MVKQLSELLHPLQGKPISPEDFWALPADGLRYECIGGILQVSASPVGRHQIISVRFGRFTLNHLDIHPDLGIICTAPLDVVLSYRWQDRKPTVVEPDLIFIRMEQIEIFDPTHHPPVIGVPDWIVEILSPSNTRYDTHVKRTLYHAHRVREYWVVDGDKQLVVVDVLQPDGTYRQQTYRSPAQAPVATLPGCSISLTELFQSVIPPGRARPF